MERQTPSYSCFHMVNKHSTPIYKKEELNMPQWLRNQLMKAFLSRDSKQIRLLNDCWYYYRAQQYYSSREKESIDAH